MLAAALADVLVRDLNPTVLAGVGDHALDQSAIALLGIDATRELGPGRGNALGKPVTHALEVADAEHARAARRGHAPLEVPAGERGREDLAQLALEACDLAPEVGAGPPQLGRAVRAVRRRVSRRRRSYAPPPLSRSWRDSSEKLGQCSGPFDRRLA